MAAPVVFQLDLTAEDVGKATAKQVRAAIKNNIPGFGVCDEVRVTKSDESTTCLIFFTRLLGKGTRAKEALENGDDQFLNIFGNDCVLTVAEEVKGSGGGATSGTSRKKKPDDGKGKGKGKGKGGKGKGKGAKGKGGGGGGNQCFDFQKGECDRGEDCRFSHAAEGEEPAYERRERRAPREGGNSRPRGVCFDFQKGECERGDDCRFSHSDEPQEPRAPRERRQGGGGGVCFAWQKGECERGDDCRFAHSDEPQEARPQRARGKCYDFKNNNCERGDNCRFSHEADEVEDDGEGEWSAAPTSGPRRGGKGKGGKGAPRRGGKGKGKGGGGNRACFDFQRGECDRGDACRFSHEAPAAAEDAAEE